MGQVSCNVTSVTNETITCVLNEDSAGLKPVVVRKVDVGLSNSNILFNYTFRVSQVVVIVDNLVITNQVPEGSLMGGNNLTLIGDGFSYATLVMICGVPCVVQVRFSTKQMVCAVPGLTTVSGAIRNSAVYVLVSIRD